MRPPQESRVHAWKAEMSQEDQAQFEEIAGHLLRELGYGER
jgi:hypothetical protein